MGLGDWVGKGQTAETEGGAGCDSLESELGGMGQGSNLAMSSGKSLPL